MPQRHAEIVALQCLQSSLNDRLLKAKDDADEKLQKTLKNELSLVENQLALAVAAGCFGPSGWALAGIRTRYPSSIPIKNGQENNDDHD